LARCRFCMQRQGGEWQDPECSNRGYTPHRDGKSAEVIERKVDMGRPLRKRVRKRLRAKRLNKRDAEDNRARERGLGIKSGLEFGKHGKE
jgi:hypothetical protein